MILYHGTSSKYLEAIRQAGLQPRRTTKRRSNWKGKIRSKPDFVYLTDAYPVYFAFAAARGRHDILLVKVEVDEAQLYPDEDFVALVLSGSHGEHSRELIARINPVDHQELWRESLTRNGVVCTPTIPAEGILDCRVISRNSLQVILALGGDAQPTPLNYRIMGDFYRRCIGCLFEGGNEAALEEARRSWSRGS